MRHLKTNSLAVIASVAVFGCSVIISLIAAPTTTTVKSDVPLSVSPGPSDARIAYVTARLLEEFHYLQEPLDTEMSERFFDGYLDTLDPRRENFLQSDIA